MALLLKVGRSPGSGKILECGTTAAGTEGAAALRVEGLLHAQRCYREAPLQQTATVGRQHASAFDISRRNPAFPASQIMLHALLRGKQWAGYNQPLSVHLSLTHHMILNQDNTMSQGLQGCCCLKSKATNG
jgi:hypothetical protein